MAAKTIHISLPEKPNNFVQRTVKAGRYQNADDVVREALRRMEAAELNEELRQFEQAFAGGHAKAESEEDIKRVEVAVHAGRKK